MTRSAKPSDNSATDTLDAWTCYWPQLSMHMRDKAVKVHDTLILRHSPAVSSKSTQFRLELSRLPLNRV